MLCNGKTGCTLGNPSEVFAKAFPRSAHGLADVNRGAVTAGDAVHKTRRQIGEGRSVDDGLFRGTQRICSFKYLFLGRFPAGWQIIFV